jgi:hypothetical protein
VRTERRLRVGGDQRKEGPVAESTGAAPAISVEAVQILAAAAGVELGAERAAALVPQAEPHLGLMREVDGLDARGAEPAGEFRLDAWRRSTDG